MKRVFISYSRADESRVNPIVDALKTEGISVQRMGLFETESVEMISASLKARIRDSAAVVAVWSSEASRSHWVLFEMGLAVGAGKRVIAILMDGDRIRFPSDLSGLPVIDAQRMSPTDVAIAVRRQVDAK